MVPEQLKYTQEHEWARLGDDGVVRVGITHYAQQQLGDVVFVQLPGVGDAATAGEPIGEVESTKSVSEIYAPLTGTVTAVNTVLEQSPELVNTEPYERGWMFELRLPDPSALEGLLDAGGYRALIG